MSSQSFTEAMDRGLSTSNFDLSDNVADCDERVIETAQVEELMQRMGCRCACLTYAFVYSTTCASYMINFMCVAYRNKNINRLCVSNVCFCTLNHARVVSDQISCAYRNKNINRLCVCGCVVCSLFSLYRMCPHPHRSQHVGPRRSYCVAPSHNA